MHNHSAVHIRIFHRKRRKTREIPLDPVENSVENLKNSCEYSFLDVILHYYKG